MKKILLIEKVKSLSNYQIIDVIKNYKKYNYPKSVKEEAIKIFKKRKISQDELEKIQSDFEIINQNKKAKFNLLYRFYKNYIINNIIANIFMLLAVISIVFAFINENFFERTIIASLLGAFCLVIFYIISLIAFKNYISFYEIYEKGKLFAYKKGYHYFFISWFVGLIINIIIMKKKMKEYK